MKLLLVEDDHDLAETIARQLKPEYEVDVVETGDAALTRGQSQRYDAIVLDWLLPELSGLAVCQQLREAKVTTPILMLTAQQETEQIVLALDSGADDYLTKPFKMAELSARLRALLRRPAEQLHGTPLVVGDLMIDSGRHRVERAGQAITLRRKEFLLLEYLARHAGQVVTRQMIADHVWDTESERFSNTIDVHIKYVREKIDEPFEERLIKTVSGVGYTIEV